MRREYPPHWLERILRFLLPERDRQTITGDLLEEFAEQLAVRGSYLGATLWYVRQILSFVPAWLGSSKTLRPLLHALCLFTALCGLWLGAMGLRLKHPGYEEGEMISGIIVSQALLTMAAMRWRRIPILFYLSAMGCLGLFWLATKALRGLISGSHFEGYILVIALALFVQGIFTLATFVAERDRPKLGA